MAFAWAAVIVEGSQACESGDLPPGSRAEFWKQGDKGNGGNGTDALDGLKGCISCSQRRMGFKGIAASLLYFFDLFLEVKELGFKDALGYGVGEMFAGIDELGLDGDELIPQGVQLGELTLGRLRQGRGFWIHGAAVVGEDSGVNGIGLGQDALGASKVSDLTRIEH